MDTQKAADTDQVSDGWFVATIETLSEGLGIGVGGCGQGGEGDTVRGVSHVLSDALASPVGHTASKHDQTVMRKAARSFHCGVRSLFVALWSV